MITALRIRDRSTTMKSREFIERIRLDLHDINSKILNHKFIKDLSEGKIELNKIKYFLSQQYYIATHDARALAIMYSRCEYPDNEFFFQLLLGHQQALKNLTKDLKSLSIDPSIIKEILNHKAIAYTNFLLSLAWYGTLEEQIVAILINFPIFVSNINKMGSILKERYGIEVKFFLEAKWEKDLEDLGLSILDKLTLEGREKELRLISRLIQEYELDYWDAVYEGNV